MVRRHRFGHGRTLFITVGLVAGLLAPVMMASPALAAPGDITTVAGGGSPPDGVGDGLLATEAVLVSPWGVDETGGRLFITESGTDDAGNRVDRVRKVSKSGVISTFAGGGTIPLGDSRRATDARLVLPEGVLVDAAGNLFIADSRDHRVRKVTPGADGVVDGHGNEKIITVAGIGRAGFSGDGGPATAARLNQPLRLALDHAGALFIADTANARVRRVTPGPDGEVDGGPGEVISTVAGTGEFADTGDGGPATAAAVNPRGLTFDAAGNLYIAAPQGMSVRKVTPNADGLVDGDAGDIITTFAVFPAFPEGVDFDDEGRLYVSAVGPGQVFMVDPAGNVTHVAGTGEGFGVSSGDGGPALDAQLQFPFGISVDAAGNVYIADSDADRVRRIVPGEDGVVDGGPGEIITTFAGTGSPEGFQGDGGPASEAPLSRPADVSAAPGGVYIAESEAGRIRRVDPSGVITTVAGGAVGDGRPATSAVLDDPRGIVVAPSGDVFIADCGHQRIRRVSARNGRISTFAGGLLPFSCPSGLHLVKSGPEAGYLYVADAGSDQILKIDPSGTQVTVVAGTGSPGFSGDGGPATAAQLNSPNGVFVGSAGNIYIADTENNRVRRVDADTGIITTVAGNGLFAVGRDGVRATDTAVPAPTDVALDPAGNLVIAEGDHRIRSVSPDGIITTIAGIGMAGFDGDGGLARDARLNLPTQLDFDPAGNLFFTDRGNDRVRRIQAGSPPPPPASGCGQVITADTTLTDDVGPCVGDGIVIGADDITLDLNGRTVFGTDGPTGNVGIRILARRGVVVQDEGRSGGTVRGFDAGVAIIGGSQNTVQGLKVRDNLGLPSQESTFGDGIGVFFSSGNRILGNLVDNNGIYDGIAVLGINSHHNLVRHNQVSNTRSAPGVQATGIGILLNPFLGEELPREQSIFGNRVSDNLVQHNDNSGISNISNVDGVISGNHVLRNGAAEDIFPGNGIGVQSLELAGANTRVQIYENVVVGNGAGTSFFGDGISIGSNENRVARNEVHGNYGTGIVIRGGGPEQAGKRNEILHNDAADNAVRGGFGFDLQDTNLNFDTFEFDCDQNRWFGNIWGSGGFNPECTTTGGHPAGDGSPAAGSSSPSPKARAAPSGPRQAGAFSDADLVRGHPPMPG